MKGRDLKALGYAVPDQFLDREVESVDLEVTVIRANGVKEHHGKVYEYIPWKMRVKRFLAKCKLLIGKINVSKYWQSNHHK